jgi:hypothetical protein
MGFIQNCFIRKSTKDLTDKLYRIGNRSGRGYWHSDINTLLVCESDQYRCLDDEWGNAVSLTKKGYINCGTNEELFLSIAALRDDSDIYQWFINEKDDEFLFCNQSELKHVIDNSYDWWDYSVSDFRKATVEELINHFK